MPPLSPEPKRPCTMCKGGEYSERAYSESEKPEEIGCKEGESSQGSCSGGEIEEICSTERSESSEGASSESEKTEEIGCKEGEHSEGSCSEGSCSEGSCSEGSCSEEEIEEIGSTVCLGAAGSNSKLPQAENDNPIVEAAQDESFWSWCMPDVNLLSKLEIISCSRVAYDLSFEEETKPQIGSSEGETKDLIDSGLWSTLRANLLEKIIARLPLPGTFIRASTLSKQWQLRFDSASFQHEVNSCSIASWSSFCPLYVTNNMMALLGFERRSRRWCRLPTLSYLPYYEEVRYWERIAACGSILCLTKELATEPIFVTNPLTRQWRQLPPCPEFEQHSKKKVHVFCGGSKSYKVVICSRFVSDHGVWIFDSNDGSWTTTQFSVVTAPLNHYNCCSAVINGVLHKLFAIEYPGMDGEYCYARNSFDLKERVWTGISCLYQIFPGNLTEPPRPVMFGSEDGVSELLVCGSKLILVTDNYHYINYNDGGSHEGTLSVFELDLDEGWLVEVSTSPMGLLKNVSFAPSAVCHGDCIYIGNNEAPWIRYDLATREWYWWDFENLDKSDKMSRYYLRKWRWAPITYQPGLNPWLEI